MPPLGKRVITALPPEAQDFWQKLERLGFTDMRYRESVALPDPYGGIQVRNSEEIAPTAKVNRYVELLQAGSPPPPVVVTSDGYQIDGRTRNLAKRKVTKKGENPAHSAIVLTENFNGASTATMNKFKIAATRLNLHGENMSDRDIETVIRDVYTDDMSQTDLARMLGVSPSTVKFVVNADKARQRIEKLNESLPANRQTDTGSLNKTVLYQLETKGKYMDDKPFAELAEVSVKAGLTGPEVTSLTRELNELRDRDRQLELLDGVRDQRKLQIDGVVKKNSLAVQSMRNLAWFDKYENDPTAILETGSRAAKGAQRDKIWKTIGTLRKAGQALDNDLER